MFRVGSVTKTVTATLVMQCRDDGLLDLDDPIGKHLDLPAHRGLTVRGLLSHTAGLQREPYGDMWDSLKAPDIAQLLAELAHAERVVTGPPRYHYSTLSYAVLGHLVSELRGAPWADVLAERILRPLGMTGTSLEPGSHAVTGYLVDAHSDLARPEPSIELGAIGPASGLWSTAGDMARWAAFLADPETVDPSGTVLAASALDEMRWPMSVPDQTVWRAGFGLGVMVVPQENRAMHLGHYGAMPGFWACVLGQRGGMDTPAGLGCAVLGSSGTAASVLGLAHRLLPAVVAEAPAPIPVWRPGPAAPEPYRSVLGRWWGEGFEYVFSWRGGRLIARGADDPADRPPAVFAPLPGTPDVLRTTSGREAGELLRLTRDSGGTVTQMHWATYRFTRAQETFDGISFSASGFEDEPASPGQAR
jgi:CubicO group peptidase (beta-lactamase class C family)